MRKPRPEAFSRTFHRPMSVHPSRLSLHVPLPKRTCPGPLLSMGQSMTGTTSCRFPALHLEQTTSLDLSFLICQMGIMKYQPERIDQNWNDPTNIHTGGVGFSRGVYRKSGVLQYTSRLATSFSDSSLVLFMSQPQVVSYKVL